METNCMREIQAITPESFAKYGTILDFTKESRGEFQIILREPEKPWRMAVYRPSSRQCKMLENHPDSMETFEPIRGTSLLLAAPNNDPEAFEVFLLDKPVCFNKGIWHNVIALSDDVLIRINENLEVSGEYHTLSTPIAPRCVSVG